MDTPQLMLFVHDLTEFKAFSKKVRNYLSLSDGKCSQAELQIPFFRLQKT